MPDGMRELVDILEAMVRMKGEVADQRELFKDVCERIVKRASAQFGVRQDEVGILVLTSDAQALRFVTPHKLAELGTLPLTKRESVAVGVFNRKVGEVNNKLVTVRHVHFFETVKIRERAEPIQKMVTVPITYQDQAIGVAQISRKGPTPAEAGPDFMPADVKRAQEFFDAIAGYIVQARPDKY